MAIINSLLDNDLYKITMMQGTLHQFSNIDVEYKFRCRTKNVDLRPYYEEISQEIDHLTTLKFKPAELAYLGKLKFIKPNFLRHLKEPLILD